jgi:hypothetical protein
MRQWLEAGYFKGDLPISQQPTGPFHPLSSLFHDLSFAFRVQGQPSDGGDAEESAAREEEQRAKEEEEQRRAAGERARAQAMAAAEAEAEQKREANRAAAAEAQMAAAALQAQNEQNNSSAQLKMMLGLGQQAESNAVEAPPLADEPVEMPPPPKSKKSQKQRNQPAAAPSSPAAPQKPVWGNGSSQVKRKGMAEIQQEEARIAAITASERKASGKSSTGGWANVASSKGGSTGWQGGAVKPGGAAAAVVPAPAPAAATQPRAVPARVKPSAPSRQASAPAAMQPQHRGSQQQKAADDFGAAMSTSLESWCKDQMRKLNGSDDLTLVSFCMTLNDPAEIRQYLTAYLGSTPQVSNFATDFINKRGLGKAQVDEWESTKPKKGRKKGGK